MARLGHLESMRSKKIVLRDQMSREIKLPDAVATLETGLYLDVVTGKRIGDIHANFATNLLYLGKQDFSKLRLISKLENQPEFRAHHASTLLQQNSANWR